ncbi:hypothetical protein [Candidatus Nitrososphaera sp. FF02]|jgi:hypothetical protein|uniref:hypothetical protein n=1 Tax=Candidatus Nitrososphaera sp. FF02 TaxID=3398226 RepID=UPI0039EAF575
MSALLVLVVIPAILAFAFGVFVMVSIMPEIEDRLYYYYGFPDARRLMISQP